MLTRSFLATSAALMSCRIGFIWAMAAGKIFACSIPFTCCMLASHTLAVPSCFLYTEEAELCQTAAPVRRFCSSFMDQAFATLLEHTYVVDANCQWASRRFKAPVPCLPFS